MKNVFLLSALMMGASAIGLNAQEIMFDFANPTDLGQFTFTPMNLEELQSATYTNANDAEKDRSYKSGENHVLILEGETITKEGVSIAVSNPDKYKDYPRFFFGSISKKYPADPQPSDFYCDLRWYQKEEIKMTAPEGKKIEKVVMLATSGEFPKRANGDTMVVEETGTQTISDDKTENTWEAGESVVSEITYKASASSPTQMAYSICVTIADIDGSGVNEISDNSNAPVFYYDLTGAKRNADNLAPGVYVMRQGSKTSKIIVK
ncbi:MAG: hypothetical protein K2G53_10155 [Muribaculaceae bacterium]|nr:hypothetical protein [Muribaculaceae bacterium]